MILLIAIQLRSTLSAKTSWIAIKWCSAADEIIVKMSKEQLRKSIQYTTELMKQAAKDLDFLQAAQYRDEIIRLQKELEAKQNETEQQRKR